MTRLFRLAAALLACLLIVSPLPAVTAPPSIAHDFAKQNRPNPPMTRHVLLFVTDGGRPHARIGGLTKDEARKEDGLR